ncbi:MAG: TonB family protein [Rhodospirillales bacterium]
MSSVSWAGMRWGAAVISVAAHGAAASLAWVTIETTPPKVIEAFAVELVSAEHLKGAMSRHRAVSTPVPPTNAIDRAGENRDADSNAVPDKAVRREDVSKIKESVAPPPAPKIEIEIARVPAKPVMTESKTRVRLPEAKTPAVSFPPPPVKPTAEPADKPTVKPVERQAHLSMPRPKGPQGGAAGGQAPSKSEAEPVTAASYSVGSSGNKPPAYPERARRNAFEGRVVLRVRVGTAGASERVTVIESSGYSVLDEAARAAVMKWKFMPATRAGIPVGANLDVPIVFRLTESENR